MKRVIAFILICSIIFMGCNGDNTYKNRKAHEDKVDFSDLNEEVIINQEKDYIDANFTKMEDQKLFQYLQDTVYASLEYELGEDYTIDGVDVTYISDEYLQEMEANSRSNIYFGFTLDEIEEYFTGEKIVFTLGEDGKTVVTKYEEYDDTFEQVARNIAIGTGVILICATVSVVTGGTVSAVFAVSAKTAALCASSSGVLTGITVGLAKGIQTKDLNEAINAAVLTGSKNFKLGAIVGAISGGASKAIQIRGNSYGGKILTGLEAEKKAKAVYGGRTQVSYLHGEEVKNGTLGSTRPDLIVKKGKNLLAIEVKSYDLKSPLNKNTLLFEIKRQITARVQHMPEGTKQMVVLDVQGRGYSNSYLKIVKEEIQRVCSDVYPSLPVEMF